MSISRNPHIYNTPQDPVNPIWHDLVHLGFIEFCQRSSEYDAMINWFNSFEKYTETMLSIGTGSGKLDIMVLEKLRTVKHYTAIEPINNDLIILENLIENFDRKLSTNLVNSSFEDYQQSDKFDLILMSHCLYYIENRIESIEKALNLLNIGGVLVIFHQTEFGINEIHKEFGHDVYRYCKIELENDLNIAEISYNIDILDAYVNLDDYPKEMIHFFLEKECSVDEIQLVKEYLFEKFGNLLYHPVAAISIDSKQFI